MLDEGFYSQCSIMPTIRIHTIQVRPFHSKVKLKPKEKRKSICCFVLRALSRTNSPFSPPRSCVTHENATDLSGTNSTTASQNKCESPFSKNIWNESIISATAPPSINGGNANGENNANAAALLYSDSERLLMLQKFASNNYCSSDESNESLTIATDAN